MAYLFDPVLPSINVTSEWIDNKTFKTSPLSFKAPAVWPDYKLYWGYAKKTVRDYYVKNLRHHIEPYLRKTKISWYVDLEPLDFRTAKPQLKTNRQILLIFALISWLVEDTFNYVWDLVFPKTEEQKKAAKPKSLMSYKKKTDEPAKNESPKKNKEAREKLD